MKINEIIKNIMNSAGLVDGKYVWLQILPFIDNIRGPIEWIALLKNCQSLSKPLRLLVGGNKSKSVFVVGVPAQAEEFFEQVVYGLFPEISIVKIDTSPVVGMQSFYGSISSESELLGIDEASQHGSYHDPIKDFGSILQTVQEDQAIWMEFAIHFRRGRLQDLLHPIAPETIATVLGFYIKAPSRFVGDNMRSNIESFMMTRSKQAKIQLKKSKKFIGCTFNQLGHLYHMPLNTYQINGMHYNVYRKLSVPNELENLDQKEAPDYTILGKTDAKDKSIRFGIHLEDKRRHMYIVGKTGTGKSTFLANLVIADICQNKGVCLLDPHGDLIEDILPCIPKERYKDVILFDVGDEQYPIGFNLLQARNDEEKNRVVSGVIASFYKMFAHSRGPRMEYVLRNVLLSLMYYPHATLLHLQRVFTDDAMRDDLLTYIQDPMLIAFRKNEYGKRDHKQRAEIIGPITNKVGQFLSSSIVRNIFGQQQANLSLRDAMDTKKIILVNLSKGRIGEDNAMMIGSLFVTKIQIEAMSRANIAQEDRNDFYLYIDEFQNFVTDAFATILSEARKYRLSLIVANQYISQLQDTVKDAIFGNVGSIVSFTLGVDDAKIMSQQFKEKVSPNDLISLPKYTAYIRLMINGQNSDPFNMKTFPLPQHITDNSVDAIRDISRSGYGIEKRSLEDMMQERYATSFSKQEAIVKKATLMAKGRNQNQITIREKHQVLYNFMRTIKINNISPTALLMHDATKVAIAILPSSFARAKLPPAVGFNELGDIFKDGGIFEIPNKRTVYGQPVLLGCTDTQIQTVPNNWVLLPITTFKPAENKTDDKTDLTNQKTLQDHPKKDIIIKHPQTSKMKIENTNTIKDKTPTPENTIQATKIQNSIYEEKPDFSINDIIIGNQYEGLIKLKYNYGIFVTVKGVEGLCHKSNIITPSGYESWKKAYEIGDLIKVFAETFVDVQGEQKVVWSMVANSKQQQ